MFSPAPPVPPPAAPALPPFGLLVSGRPVSTTFAYGVAGGAHSGGAVVICSMPPFTCSFDGDRRFLMELPAPGLIGELALFLLPGAAIPPGLGGACISAVDCPCALIPSVSLSPPASTPPVTVYFSFPPYSGWDVLGVLTADSPSAMFRTNWPSTPEFAAAPVVQVGACVCEREEE